MIFVFFSMILYSTSAAPVEEEPAKFPLTEDGFKQYVTNDGINSAYSNSEEANSYNKYRQIKAQEGYVSLCWTESIIITEDKITHNQSMSKVYSIVIESSATIQEHLKGTNNKSCYEIEGGDGTKERVFNFTTIKETTQYTIKEHKTLFCGAGPVLSEHFVVWPKLNRKQIEISISPPVPMKLKSCDNDESRQTTAEKPKPSAKTLNNKPGGPANNSNQTTNEPATENLGNDNEVPKFSSDPSEVPLVGMEYNTVTEASNSSKTAPATASESSEKNIEENNVIKDTTDGVGPTSSTEPTYKMTGPPIVGMEENGANSVDSGSDTYLDVKESSTNSNSSTRTETESSTLESSESDITTKLSREGPIREKDSVSNVNNPVDKTRAKSLGMNQSSGRKAEDPESIFTERPIEAGKSLLDTKRDTASNTQSSHKISTPTVVATTENPIGTSISTKNTTIVLKKHLLNRNINCVPGMSPESCENMKSESAFIAGFQRNGSSPTLANLFFPNETFIHIFRDIDDFPYLVNVKIKVELKRKANLTGDMEDEKGFNLQMSEESLFEMSENEG